MFLSVKYNVVFSINNLHCICISYKNVFISYPYYNNIYTLGGIVLGASGDKPLSLPFKGIKPTAIFSSKFLS